jgi:hypothetical protein
MARWQHRSWAGPCNVTVSNGTVRHACMLVGIADCGHLLMYNLSDGHLHVSHRHVWTPASNLKLGCPHDGCLAMALYQQEELTS